MFSVDESTLNLVVVLDATDRNMIWCN